MILFSLICIIFITMLAFPIGIGLSIKKFESKPLFIQQSNIKDPRYFAVSFREIFSKGWNKYDGSGCVKLSQLEKVIEVDQNEIPPNNVCNSIVYARSDIDFTPNKGIHFEKEIYAKGNAFLYDIPELRAIACDKNLLLGIDTNVIRWADAEGFLIVHEDCNLGISTSSASKLFIGRNCTFKRLYAPEIYLGIENVNLHKFVYSTFSDKKKVLINQNIIRDIEYVNDDNTDENKVFYNTIITKRNITVLANFEVQGHITSHKNVKIESNAIVHGNIFAEGNVFIGSNARVLGVVFSQENIHMDPDAVVGQPGKTKSIVARGDIIIENNCRVYGYIGTEGNGIICPKVS